jgi:biotin carboxylase
MGRRLAVLHHTRSFFPLGLRDAVGDDIDLIWVLADESGADQSLQRLLSRIGSVVDIRGVGLDEAANRLGAAGPDGIVTFVDDNLRLTAQLADRLGLLYHSPEVAAVLSDKERQRATLNGAGVPGPQFWALPEALSRADLAAMSERITYPAVLKPAEGSGSRGIESLTGPADLLELYQPGIKYYIEEHLADNPDRDLRFASYLSVESVVSGGTSSHVAVTGRFPLAEPFRETGNFIPAAVAPSMHQTLFNITDAAIDALGIATGVLHTEIKLTPNGPRVIELNGRLGGRPPFVLQSVSDLNLFRVACRVALGDSVSFPGLAACDGVGYWRMVQPPRVTGFVGEIRGLAELSHEPYVDTVRLVRQPGDPVDWREGTDGQIVTVRGRVADLDALVGAIASIDERVEVDYELADGAPEPAAGQSY